MNGNRIQQLLEFLRAEPNDVFLNYALGVEYAADLQNQIAETQFKKVLDINGNYIAAHYQLGKLYESQFKTAEALQQYKTGLEKAKQQNDKKAVNEFGEAVFMLED